MKKILSLRIQEIENRKIIELIKMTIGNTPQQVKRGETIAIEGMATPDTTLTFTSKKFRGIYYRNRHHTSKNLMESGRMIIYFQQI